MFYPQAKIRCQGAANIAVPFNPSSFYTNNGNYLKFVIYADWNSSALSANYLYNTQQNWFSIENFSGNIYINLGDKTSIGSGNLTNTSEFTYPIVCVLDNGTLTVSQNAYSDTYSISSFGTGTLTFFQTRNSANADINFYGFEVYSDADTLAYKYVPWKDGSNNPCIVNALTDDVYYPTGSNYTLTYESLANFEPSEYTFTFNANGGTETFTVTAGYAWTCETPTYFTISPLSGSTGDTTVTLTATTTIGGRSETITFTDSETNTFDISISQTGDGLLVPFKKIIRGTRRIN